MLIIRGVNVFPSQIEEIILEEREFVPLYPPEVDRGGHVDALTIRVSGPPAARAERRREKPPRGYSSTP